MLGLRSLSLLCFPMILMATRESSGFSLINTLDKVAFWNEASMPLTFDYNITNCTGVDREVMLSELKKGLELWNRVPGTTLRMQLGRETSETHETLLSGGSEVANPLIECRRDFVNKFAGGDATSRRIAVGGYVSAGFAGQRMSIRKGYIMLNSDPTSDVGDYMEKFPEKIFFTVAHEAGHVVGLDHSADEDCVMNYKQPVEDGLGLDDYYAVRYLYPTEESIDDLTGCGSVPPGSLGPKRLLVLFLYALPWLLVLILRQRQGKYVKQSVF